MGLIRGQIWIYVAGSRQLRVLVVSSDEYNDDESVNPWGLAVVRASIPSALSVQLPAGDPLAGAYIEVPNVFKLDRTGLRENLGFVSNATMNAVEFGLRELLVLP